MEPEFSSLQQTQPVLWAYCVIGTVITGGELERRIKYNTVLRTSATDREADIQTADAKAVS